MKKMLLALGLFLCFFTAQAQDGSDEAYPDVAVIDEAASPSGGMKMLYNFINRNLIYPDLAKQKGIQGKVVLSFVVETDGTVSEVKVVKGIGGGCDEEAARVIALYDQWNPATSAGRPTRMKMMLPISFVMTEEVKQRP